MPRYASLIIGIVMLAGSVLAIGLSVATLTLGLIVQAPNLAVLLLTFVFFGFGAWSGIQAIRQRTNWPRHARWFWLVQIPMYSSSTFSFSVACGAGVWTFLRLKELNTTFGASAYFGSGFSLTYHRASPSLVIGINLLAAAIAIYLFLVFRRPSPGEA
jgi:hypothetical protein